nr:hypothetical protein [Chloroflexota bacterium]
MIHEHEDLLLASAAMDFGLSQEEADRLSQAIEDCPVCAERAAAYRRQLRLLSSLPEIEPSDALRRKVMAAALSGGRTPSRTPLILLAAALVIGSVMAVAVAAGGAFRERTTIVAEFPPNATPSAAVASDVAVASDAPPSVEPSQPVVGPGGAPAVAVDSIAEVVSSNLRIRSQPRTTTDSIKFEPFLAIGDRLFLIDGPVVASNHDWYQVAAWRPSDPSRSWPIGWVASADSADGSPWIAGASVECPKNPTVDVLAAMNRYEALACFGDRTIAF